MGSYGHDACWYEVCGIVWVCGVFALPQTYQEALKVVKIQVCSGTLGV